MTIDSNICILNQPCPEKAKALSETLQLPICSNSSESKHDQPNAPQWLTWISDKKDPTLKLALCSKSTGPVSVDFLAGKKAHRRQFGGGKGQPLVRAMGQTETGLPNIVDATAGMGGDSFVLATLGFNVKMVERSPIVASLLADALERAQTDLAEQPEEVQQSIQRLSLVNSDSATYLLETTQSIDVVYMDPMYPEKKKKAAAKKEMQALQSLVGPDIDSSNLLDAALQTAQLRVVVKRPKGAEPVQSIKYGVSPSTQISSPNTRYDIYVIKALKASNPI